MTKTRKLGIVLAPAVLGAMLAMPAAAQETELDPNPRADESWIRLSGMAVDVQEDVFTLDYGEGTVVVEIDDTLAMDYNPLDDKGFQKIDVGAYVSVGNMDKDVWDNRELMAKVIVILQRDRDRQTSS